jgi:esterase/lipase superfamily enzyme
VWKKPALVLFLVTVCYALGLITASYFPIPAHVGAVLTRLLQGRVRLFSVSRNFNETIGYVTDRKPGSLADGNVTYLGEYAGQVSYGLVKIQVPLHDRAGSPLDVGAIKKVESVPYLAFLEFLQSHSGKPLVVWIHGYQATFLLSTSHCAQVARDLNIDANVVTFDWANSESVFGYTRDVTQVSCSTKHLVDLLEVINNEVKPPKSSLSRTVLAADWRVWLCKSYTAIQIPRA